MGGSLYASNGGVTSYLSHAGGGNSSLVSLGGSLYGSAGGSALPGKHSVLLQLEDVRVRRQQVLVAFYKYIYTPRGVYYVYVYFIEDVRLRRQQVRVAMYIFTHTNTHMYTHVHMKVFAPIYVYTRVCTHTCVYTEREVHRQVCICVYTRMCDCGASGCSLLIHVGIDMCGMCMCACVHICMRTSLNTYTHT